MAFLLQGLHDADNVYAPLVVHKLNNYWRTITYVVCINFCCYFLSSQGELQQLLVLPENQERLQCSNKRTSINEVKRYIIDTFIEDYNGN